MTTVRLGRRILVAALSSGALLAAAACGSSGSAGGASTPASADFSQQGDIELWQGKDTSGNLQKQLDQFNASHPNGKVTLHELPDAADQQRQQMLQNTQIKNPKMAVLNVDVVWTSEFAANGYLEPLPPEQFPTEGMLAPAVDSATYFGKLYAYPRQSNGGLLYYRKDLLEKYDLTPPTTFEQLRAACRTIKAGEKDDKLDCYGGQFQKYEGLTVNFAEAVNGAGGVVVGDDGKANVNTPQAEQGLGVLVDMMSSGDIPKAALTWQEEQGRTAFQDGNLIFLRNWPYVYALAENPKASKVAGKFDVAPLPGVTGAGVSSLGGGNYGIAKNAANKGTAADFVKFMASPEQQKSDTLATSQPPTLSSLYADPEVVKAYPFFPTLLTSIQGAKPRPKVVAYGDVTLAIQDSAYAALQGTTPPDAALQTMQTKLETLIK